MSVNKSVRTYGTYANCRTLTPTFDSELTNHTSRVLIFHGIILLPKNALLHWYFIIFATNLHKHTVKLM